MYVEKSLPALVVDELPFLTRDVVDEEVAIKEAILK